MDEGGIRTESHELRPDRYREHNNVQDFRHLAVGLRSLCDEYRTDIKQQCLSGVDEFAGNPKRTVFHHRTTHAGRECLIRHKFELPPKYLLISHRPNITNIHNCLPKIPSTSTNSTKSKKKLTS